VTAQHHLDRLHALSAIEALAPDSYLADLAAELPVELEPRDAALRAALQAIDRFAERVMGVRLEQSSLPPPTRRVFAHTVTSYAADLGLLAQRVRSVDPAAEAFVLAAARATLAQRDMLRTGVLALVGDGAAAAVADADRRARDRALDDAQRRRWSAVRRELEALVADPSRIATAPFAARIAAFPDQLDEPAAEPEPSLASLIEID